MKVTIKISTLVVSALVVVVLVVIVSWVLAPAEPAQYAEDDNMMSHHQTQPTDTASLSALVGRAAADFSLPSYQGSAVTLSQLRGKKVVLFFNEGLMCYPGCWNQITAFAKDERFTGDNVVALSIVTDPREQWRMAVAKVPDLAQATVLFDTGGAVSRAYGMLNLPSSMHPGRLPGHTYVVIDANGVVQSVKDDPMMGIRNDELANELAKLL